MTLKTDKGVVLAKNEATEGVDATPTGALNAILATNISVTPLVLDGQKRNLVRPFFGNDEDIPVGSYMQLSFDVELAGSGAAGTAPAFAPLLKSTGMAETVDAGVDVVYAPITDSVPTSTIVYNLNGVQHKMLGARGSKSLTLDARGIPRISFSFTGIYADVVDAVVGSVDFSAFLKPEAVNNENTTTCSLLGQDVTMNTFSIDGGETVSYQNLVGRESVELTARETSGSIQFENVTVATYDWWAAVKAGTSGTLAFVHGDTAGNIVEINAPKVQPTAPTIGDYEGVSMLGLSLNFIPTDAGNDELTLTFK